MGDNKRKRETEKDTMGDDKRETKIEKIEEEDSGSAPSFEELRDDLFREAAKLVSEDPSLRIAVFVGPPASDPDGPVHAFGYPSAEAVAKTFLEDNRPVPEEEEDDVDEEEGDEEEEEDVPAPRRFWWEDPKLFETENPEELDALHERLLRERDFLALRLEALQRDQGSENKDNDKPAAKH